MTSTGSGKSFERLVRAETLDDLPATDANAIRSRFDLQRIHRIMGTRSIVCSAVDGWAPRLDARPLRVLELGAGDGTLMLGVAQALRTPLAHVELTLLDRQALVEAKTVSGYAKLGWSVEIEVTDVSNWIRERLTGRVEWGHSRWDMIIANLFIHHFEGPQLLGLLHAISVSCDRFFACEPRRSRVALAASHLVGAIGANAVTRNDAVLSVHAGFRDGEMSEIWPAFARDWILRENSAGMFSHCFAAHRSRLSYA